ncbi:MAG: hypothetical protein PHD48_02800 [Alphaproteobacteria bacterium]|nr:hypothetical protein [Alphaproteobacteria bacterium]
MSHEFSHTVGRFFSAPTTGRRIIAGFSHLQRVGKGTSTNVWFPEKEATLDAGQIEWAAVREFDVLQEADNYYIYDMNVSDLKYSYQNIGQMRAGGYRISIVTLGRYTAHNDMDDLQILDIKLQEEITRMIHFLYLSELSEQACHKNAAALDANTWCLENNLEHIALTMATKRLYKPQKETLAERTFFDILARLPKHHIIHDNGVGLQLPESTKEKNQVYVAKGENQLWQFQQTITTVFENLDKNRATMTHMRGYGDHLKEGFSDWQRQSLAALAA